MQRSILQPIGRWQRPDETCRMLATTDLTPGSSWSCPVAPEEPHRERRICGPLGQLSESFRH
jgi:hypothetical protein